MVSFTVKYKPKCLADVVYPDIQTQNDIMSYQEGGRFNPIILSGTYGTGKTTIAKLLPMEVAPGLIWLNDVKYINGSLVRGINLIRDIEVFLNLCCWNMYGYRFVIIDEAEQLTAQAQYSMKGLMDDFIEDTMFIFTTNYIDKIDGGIQSRSQRYLFDPPPVAQLVPLVERVLKSEMVTMSAHQINQYIARYGASVRGLLMQLETDILNFRRTNNLLASIQAQSCATTLIQPSSSSAAPSAPASSNTPTAQSPQPSAAPSTPLTCNATSTQSPPSSQAA
jgi:DNA polymerase III delta prime subunit